MELTKLIFIILVWLVQLWSIPWVYRFLLVFLVTPSENQSSTETHLDLLRIGSNPSNDLSGSTPRSITTDEGSALVRVASSTRVLSLPVFISCQSVGC